MKNGVSAFAAIIVAGIASIGIGSAAERKISAHAVDWSNPEQVNAVYKKLSRAAEAMCASTGAPRREIMRCVDLTLSATIEESGRTQLRDLHHARFGSADQEIPS